MKKAGVPREAQRYRTKHELALDLIERALSNGVQFSWVGFDGFYGENGQLLRMLDGAGLTFTADVHCDHYVWEVDPTSDPNARPMRVDEWAQKQGPSAWKRVLMRQGTKGEMYVEMLHGRVWCYQRGEKHPYLWHLIVTRQPNRLKFSLSNAAPETTSQRLAYMQGQRYFIERALQDAKHEGGLDEYQVRGWRGWHHHTALVMLAMLFITRERVIEGDTVFTAADVRMMLVHILPKANRTENDILDFLKRRFARRGETLIFDPPEK